jgi:xylose isomerase
LNSIFPFLPHHVRYDPNSTDPFTFRYYNKNEVIAGKTMGEWMRFSIAFWHTFRGDGSDPFGAPTKVRGCGPLASAVQLRCSRGGWH